MRNREKQTNDGITLIALVITIIVLLILAGVTIATLTGDNGILTRAQEARMKTEEAQSEEETDLSRIESSMNSYLNEYDKWDGTSISEPTIEDETDIYIYTCAELKWLSDKVNNGETFTGYTVHLMNNLDFGAKKENEIWETENNEKIKWIPVGSYNNDSSYRLNATFEGNNHIIKGIYVNSGNNYIGVFGNANTIKNVTIKDSYIKGAECTGGIVGALREGTIENCKVENIIIVGNRYVGGITGQATGDNILNCSSSATITGNGYIGGIVGTAINGNIKNSYNTGNVTGSSYVGGIAGSVKQEITNCYNSGKITSTLSNGGTQSAGIVGSLSGGTCYNCYNTGEVIAPTELTGVSWAGGIIGTCYSEATVYDCYNYGKVTALYCGAAIGRLYGNSNAYDCYYLEGTAVHPIQNCVQGTYNNVVSKTSEEMNVDILLDWLNNEEILWKEDSNHINNGYPILSWQ